MKNNLLYYLLITLSIVVNSCGTGYKDESSLFSVVLTEVTAITTPTTDTTPDYTFSSTELGAITYGGSCSSSTTIAISGNNTIILNSLSDGTYTDCTIKVSKTMTTKNSETNLSGSLTITSFTITTTITDTTAPTVSSVSTTADNQSSVSITDNITVTFSEAMDNTSVTTGTSDTNCAGTLWLSSDNFNTCVRMSSEPISSNSNMTFTLDPVDNLTVGTTYKTRVTTGVRDTAGNAMSSRYDTSSGFTPADLTAPTVSSVSTTADNQSSVSITDNITVTFSEAMDTTYVTTNTDNTSCYGTLGVSSDNFSSCVQMSSVPSSSSDNMTFILNPSDNLTGGTTYLTRVTTGVKDSAGNTLSSQYETSSGFTTSDDSSSESSTQMGGSIQGTELDLSTAVTTLAGGSLAGSTDHNTGTSAQFYYPSGITTDGTNLYVADYMNHRIRKIVISTGVVTTLAGSSSGSTDHNTGTSASFNAPEGITTDGTNLYVADTINHRIRKIVISTGVVTTLAGSSSGSTDHNTGTSASFSDPSGITTDGTNLYVVDKGNHRIRKIVISTGVVTTLAGSSSGSTDHNTGTSASFKAPRGITTDGTNLYVVDKGNHRIRKIVISTGVVTTLAGSSSGSTDHNTGTSASFNAPRGITTDGTNLYVADYDNHRIRKIVIDNGTVTTLAGSSFGFTDHNTGTSAQFYYPWGITTDGTNLYVADYMNHRIRKIE